MTQCPSCSWGNMHQIMWARKSTSALLESYLPDHTQACPLMFAYGLDSRYWMFAVLQVNWDIMSHIKQRRIQSRFSGTTTTAGAQCCTRARQGAGARPAQLALMMSAPPLGEAWSPLGVETTSLQSVSSTQLNSSNRTAACNRGQQPCTSWAQKN